MDVRKLTILFGSQTGGAQEVAERIWRESKRFYFHGPVLPMDEYRINDLIYEPCVIFVCSTTGQGEEPDNMKHFWKFLLRKNLPAESLQGLRYSVLGMGDSSYVHFNYVGKKLHQRLSQLGGRPFHSLGLADDQHDLGADAAIDPWIQSIWLKLTELYPLANNVKPLAKDLLPLPRWNVFIKHMNAGDPNADDSKEENLVTVNSNNTQKSENVTHDEKMTSCVSQVFTNRRTTDESHFQDVRLIEFSAPGLSYNPGDVLYLVPHNLPSNVEALLEVLSSSKLTPRSILQVEEISSFIPVPSHLQQTITVRECAEKYWDLSAIPRRYLFQLMFHFTTSEIEKEKLLEFNTAEGQQELYNYANRPHRTVIETLQDFPHAAHNLPVAYLFEVFQTIRPRAFSIASSPKAHPHEVHVLVAVVNYKTKLVKPRLGLCSNWLASLKFGDKVPLSVRRGSFKFPDDPNVPVIMIGPGTGVSPFRSYINERVASECLPNLLYLFFGCRNKLGDFHCQEEWMQMIFYQQLALYCAFSRDQEKKIYVQHLIEKQSDRLWKLLVEDNASIFLAGSSKNMPSAVKDSFINVAMANGKSADEAVNWIKDLETQGRYQTETWS